MNDWESAQKAAKFKADDQTAIFKRQNRTPTFFVFIDWNEDSSVKVNSLEMEGDENLLAIFPVCKKERNRKATV